MSNSDNRKKMFDNIAKNYDKLNNIISLNTHSKIKEKAILNANIKPDFKVLDICTGTGDIAIYLAKNILKNGTVIGVDFSDEMLKLAKEKSKNLKTITFKNADALNLPFKDNEFDVCITSFGLRNLTDLKKGLLEMKRVTKRGGLIINLDTGKPKFIVKIFHDFFFFKLVPIFGKIFNGDSQPYKYLPISTMNFPSPDKLTKIFDEIGLKDIKRYDFLFGAISEQIGKV